MMSGYEDLFGTTPGVTLAVTLMLMGGCALMTGRALALNWRSAWQLVFYCLLLGLADRFLVFALFGGALLSLSGYLIDTVLLLSIAALVFRVSRVRQMVRQYPWLYERAGPLGWRARREG